MRLAHARRAPRRQLGRAESGETLTELLVTMILMTTAIASIIGGLWTVVKTAAMNREKTRSSVAVQTVVEKLKQPVGESSDPLNNMEYVPCGQDPLSTYSNKLRTYLSSNQDQAVRGVTVEITGIKFAQGGWMQGPKPTVPVENGWVFDYTGTYPANGVPLFWAPTFGASCPRNITQAGVVRDGGLQEITLKVTSRASSPFPSTDTLVVVKRDARCPDESFGFDNVDAGPC